MLTSCLFDLTLSFFWSWCSLLLSVPPALSPESLGSPGCWVSPGLPVTVVSPLIGRLGLSRTAAPIVPCERLPLRAVQIDSWIMQCTHPENDSRQSSLLFWVWGFVFGCSLLRICVKLSWSHALNSSISSNISTFYRSLVSLISFLLPARG